MYVVRSLSAMARFLHFSEFVLSFLLLSVATSLPEITVGINSALSGVPELSLGDILGTNIVNLTLIMGFVSVIGGEMELKDYKHFKEGRVISFLFICAPLILLVDGSLSRLDGIFLLVFAVLNAVRMLAERDIVIKKKAFRPHLAPHAAHTIETKEDFIKKAVTFALSVPILLFAAYLMVVSVTNISQEFGIPEFLIGIFVIGIGTSLPELSIGIRSVKSDRDGVSLGDLFGSAVMNSTLILGIVSLIEPIYLTAYNNYIVTGIFTVFVILLAFMFLRKKSSITRKEGIILLIVYAAFVTTQIIVF